MKEKIASTYKTFISGMWFVHIVRQLVVTSGNIAESAFLLATLWVITNAVAHTLVTWIMDAHTIELINNLSTIAFGALPELIFISVVCTCFNHWSATIKQKSKASGTWAILYTIPACFFAVITISAITTFVSTKGVQTIPMDPAWLVIRCLSGWFYAVINMLFQKLGEPHYASNLESLKTSLEEKQTEIERLTSHFENALKTANSHFKIAMDAKQTEFEDHLKLVIEQSKTEIEYFQNLIESQNEQVKRLSERASSLTLTGLENYPKVLTELVNQEIKTVSVDDLSELTGISKRRINAAKTLQRTSRNKDLILVSSVVEWLKTMPIPTDKSEPKTDPIPVQKPATNGHRKVTQPLDNLVNLEV